MGQFIMARRPPARIFLNRRKVLPGATGGTGWVVIASTARCVGVVESRLHVRRSTRRARGGRMVPSTFGATKCIPPTRASNCVQQATRGFCGVRDPEIPRLKAL